MDYTQNNLEKLRVELQMSNRDFAEKIGIGETVYSKLKKGTLPLGEKTIQKIMAAFPKYNVDWILYNIGDKIKPPEQSPVKPYPQKVISNAILLGEVNYGENESPFIEMGDGQLLMIVPLVPVTAQAGYLENYNNQEYISERYRKHYFPVQKEHRGHYMAFIVEGESMTDGTPESILEGSIVTGREIQRHLWQNKLHLHRFKDYIIVYKDGIIVKRIINHDTENGTITYSSLNPDKKEYPDETINLDDCRQIFNIINITQQR